MFREISTKSTKILACLTKEKKNLRLIATKYLNQRTHFLNLNLQRGKSFSRSGCSDDKDVVGAATGSSSSADGTSGFMLVPGSSASAQLKGVDLASDSRSPL